MLHLHNGRNILWDYLSYSRPGIHSFEEDEVEALVLSEAASSTEDKLVEIFARLDIQSTNFGSSKPRFCLLTEKSASTAKGELRIPEAFGSLLEARQNLDALLNAISRFLGIAPDATVHRSDNAPAVAKRDALLTKLEQWAAAFFAYQATHHFPIRTTPDPRAAQKSTLLLLHHTYLTLKLSTWFYPGFETKYDAYTPQFLTLITLAESMSSTGDKRGSGLPPFSLDTGTIQPLYYTILHCRVRALRRRALRVLAETPHREGAWDAAFLATVGARIVELEEMGGDENGLIGEEARFCEVKIYIPGDGSEGAVMWCKSRRVGGDREGLRWDGMEDGEGLEGGFVVRKEFCKFDGGALIDEILGR